MIVLFPDSQSDAATHFIQNHLNPHHEINLYHAALQSTAEAAEQFTYFWNPELRMKSESLSHNEYPIVSLFLDRENIRVDDPTCTRVFFTHRTTMMVLLSIFLTIDLENLYDLQTENSYFVIDGRSCKEVKY